MVLVTSNNDYDGDDDRDGGSRNDNTHTAACK
jgi:hypothetical protein